MGFWLPPKRTQSQVRRPSSLVLDSTLGEAHISLAWCLDGFDWDWEAGGMEFTRGIDLSPGYATGHHWYGWHLAAWGNMPKPSLS